jgi:hypothetical protein
VVCAAGGAAGCARAGDEVGGAGDQAGDAAGGGGAVDPAGGAVVMVVAVMLDAAPVLLVPDIFLREGGRRPPRCMVGRLRAACVGIGAEAPAGGDPPSGTLREREK